MLYRSRSSWAFFSSAWSLASGRLGLLERHLIGSRIDLGEEIALLDHLALFEGDLGQIAVDLGLYRDRGERGDGAELAQADGHVALLHRNHPDRHRTAGAPAPGFLRLRIGAGKYHTAAATIIRTNTSQRSRFQQAASERAAKQPRAAEWPIPCIPGRRRRRSTVKGLAGSRISAALIVHVSRDLPPP